MPKYELEAFLIENIEWGYLGYFRTTFLLVFSLGFVFRYQKAHHLMLKDILKNSSANGFTRMKGIIFQ